MPRFGPSLKDLASFIKANKPRTVFWNNFYKYIVSILKAYYGDAATKESDFGFNWLPRLSPRSPSPVPRAAQIVNPIHSAPKEPSRCKSA
jgi:hypothetical protein